MTLRQVGSNGGSAAAFSYDLARSVVYTRQGNPAWAGEDRDGIGPIRADDLFFGDKAGDPQPDWVDLNKVAIPQADEQQRLLTNLIGQMNLDRKPLPKFWFLPRDKKAAVVMTGDDHGNGGTVGRFEQMEELGPPGCSVANWECVRATSYIYPNTPISDLDGRQTDRGRIRDWAALLDELRRLEQHLAARNDLLESTRRMARGLPEPQRPIHQPHPLHHLERLGQPAEGRAEKRHSARHQLLLLACRVDSEPAWNVHGIRNADAIRRSQRLADQRLSGHHPDDRRVGSVIPRDNRRTPRRRAGSEGVLRGLHRQHAHRRRSLQRQRSDRQRCAGKRCAGRVGEADAHLARRSESVLLRLDRVGRRQTPVHSQPRAGRDGPEGDGADLRLEREISNR